MFSVELQNAGFETKIAEEDADSLIIEKVANLTAVNNIIIVGDDVDLNVLLTQLIPSTKNMFLLEKGKGRYVDQWYSNNSFKYPELSKYVAFFTLYRDVIQSLYFINKGRINY